MKPVRSAAVVVALAAPLALAACTADAPAVDPTTPQEPSSTVEPSVEPEPDPTTPSPSPSSAPGGDDGEPEGEEAPFPADLSMDTAEPSPEAFLSPVDLRFGAHDGYDRVVLELTGEGEPGWWAEYVEEPVDGASGLPIDVEGEAFLRVIVRGVAYPTEPGAVEYAGEDHLSPDGVAVGDVRLEGIFEGQQELYLGVSDRLPFRVFRLEDPARVVIDVQHR